MGIFKGSRIVLPLVLFLLAGCASAQKQTFKMDSLTLYNKTSAKMQDVELIIPDTNKKIYCSAIEPYQEFYTKYPARKYQEKEIRLVWTHRDKKWDTGLFTVGQPKRIREGVLVKPIVYLGEQGSVAVKFKQI